jgi:adenylate cyclase
VLSLLVALAGWTVQALGVFEPLDRKLLDLYFLARGERDVHAPIVIVAIDYESLLAVEHRWPWPRSVHARLLEKLAAAGAAVIAFDVLFLDRDPPEDAKLARAASAAGNVVWASSFVKADQQGFVLTQHRAPLPEVLVASASFGYVNLRFDPDGIVRRVAPFASSGGQVYKSFGVAVAERFRRQDVLRLTADGLRAPLHGGRRVAAEADGSLLINFAAPPDTFRTVPYVRVLDGTEPPGLFKNKIVLIGAATESGDVFFTPFYSRLLPETRKLMPGVEVHANVIDMLLQDQYLARASGWWTLALWLVLGAASAVLVGWPRPWVALAALVVALVAQLAGAYACFTLLNVWLPAAGSLVSASVIWGFVVFWGLLAERRERRFVRSVLDVYVAPSVIEHVIDQRIDLALGGQRTSLTILFADVRGFTALSERVRPETVVKMLGEYFAATSHIVLRHHGTLDKFIGDAVMAFWGAPTPNADDPLRAVRAALEMQVAMRALAASMRERFGEALEIGIGLNTGDAVVGHIGSRERITYTAVGDPVNLASRVEAMTREYSADVLITQFTYERVKYDVEAEMLGFLPIRGRHDPVALYRVLGLKEAAPGYTPPP